MRTRTYIAMSGARDSETKYGVRVHAKSLDGAARKAGDAGLRDATEARHWHRVNRLAGIPVRGFLTAILACLLLTGCSAERIIENGPNGPETNRLRVWPLRPPCNPAPVEPKE